METNEKNGESSSNKSGVSDQLGTSRSASTSGLPAVGCYLLCGCANCSDLLKHFYVFELKSAL